MEQFSVGRRLAFDAQLGRLWCVCPSCYRWNLVPLEERWEAIESCERLFASAQERISTGQIGLSYHRSGLSLVRVGSPDAHDELVFWRFGRAIRSRARQTLMVGGAGAILATAGAFGTLAGVASLAGLSGLVNLGYLVGMTRPVTRIRISEKRTRLLRRAHIGHIRVELAGSDGVEIRVRDGSSDFPVPEDEVARMLLRGLPYFNRSGDRQELDEAAKLVRSAPSPQEFIQSVFSDTRWMKQAKKRAKAVRGEVAGYVAQMPKHLRLAVEMALNAEREESAAKGELRALEIAWREAEELAGISDGLLAPPGWARLLEAAGREPSDSP